jgi:DNA modification methylase
LKNQLLWPDIQLVQDRFAAKEHKPREGSIVQATMLAQIEQLDQELRQHFHGKLLVDSTLTRQLVSFQASKNKAEFRWYKFKEAFSASLIEYLLRRYEVVSGRLLDPFAGSGTALFVAREQGLDVDGIEVLASSQALIEARLQAEQLLPAELATLRRWAEESVWEQCTERVPLLELRITKGAYPAETKAAIEKYLAALSRESSAVQALLRFAVLCVLESVSYTRKDGQYLRWDHRSGRTQGRKPFDKGLIGGFKPTVSAKLREIVADLESKEYPPGLFQMPTQCGSARLFAGSCLDKLPELPDAFYDAVITSPPYCNRYDYTRTYALELALLGVGEKELVKLRQQMLSCTVENRAKDLLQMNPRWAQALGVADEQSLLQSILQYLEAQKEQGALNNNGIPRMVRGYFYEMACVIAECARVLKPGAPLLMVNDNVRYAGAGVSVDLILSALAEQLGFTVQSILVLPNGKGNSSQQMGAHGRAVLRKCIYVWRKK